MLFNDTDVAFIVERFGLEGLREERRKAESQLHIALYMDDDTGIAFYEQYLEIINTGIKLIQFRTPKQKLISGQISIQQIKGEVDIVSIIEKYLQLRKTSSRFSAICPFHQHKDPNNHSLMIYPESQSWYCFGCLKGGDVIDFIQNAEHCDIKQAAAILRG